MPATAQAMPCQAAECAVLPGLENTGELSLDWRLEIQDWSLINVTDLVQYPALTPPAIAKTLAGDIVCNVNHCDGAPKQSQCAES